MADVQDFGQLVSASRTKRSGESEIGYDIPKAMNMLANSLAQPQNQFYFNNSFKSWLQPENKLSCITLYFAGPLKKKSQFVFPNPECLLAESKIIQMTTTQQNNWEHDITVLTGTEEDLYF